MFNYQNYLQQYQHTNDPNSTNTNNNNSNKKINAKLKIVQMRNRNESQNSLNQTNFSNQNVNLISNSSSSASIHSNDNEPKAALTNDTSLNDCSVDNERDTDARTLTIPSRSNSAKIVSVCTGGLRTQVLSNSSTSSVANANPKRSTAYNNGSNVHEDNVMYFYGSKSLDILENKLDPNVISQINMISFNYIDFDDSLIKNFFRIKNKFPNAMVN